MDSAAPGLADGELSATGEATARGACGLASDGAAAAAVSGLATGEPTSTGVAAGDASETGVAPAITGVAAPAGVPSAPGDAAGDACWVVAPPVVACVAAGA
jgi:hypothetical protein